MLQLFPSLLAMSGVFLIFFGVVAMQRQRDTVQDRLSKYGVPARTLEELELRQPFSDRVLKPIIQAIASIVMSRTPPKTVESIQHRIILAGNPNNIDVRDFLGLKGTMALTIGALVFFVMSRNSPFLTALLLGVVLGVIGFVLPDFWLGSKIKKRKKEISKALPDALDLLTVCVEAGLGFDSAMAKVVQKWQNALSMEFARVLSEMRMGKARRDALKSLVQRTEVPDVATFISAIIQADQLGVSIGKVLHIQSEQIRLRRRQQAEELAHKAPIKMVFPMVFFIFPSIYVVVLGPAVPIIVNGLMKR